MSCRHGIEGRRFALLRSGAALFCGVAILLLTGCAQLGNSELQFNPSIFPECQGPDIAVEVSWDATSRTREPIRLVVYKPGQRPKIWYEGPPKGHQQTGKWMADGSTIRLMDAHNKLLAERTLETIPCQGTSANPER